MPVYHFGEGYRSQKGGRLLTGQWTIAGSQPGHSRVTHSRNRAVLGGHMRTYWRRYLSSGGACGSQRDT